MAVPSPSPSPPLLTSFPSLKSLYCSQFCSASLSTVPPVKYPSKRRLFCLSLPHKTSRRCTRSWRIYASPSDVVPSDTSMEKAEQIIPADDSTSTIISVLLFIAFVGLSILTIGVIYIGVTDFLQKREREKFEKEEAAKKKKGGKKRKVKARTGPRGFGQKTEEDDD